MTAGKSEAAAAAAAQAAGEAAIANQQAAAAQESTGPVGSVVGGSALVEQSDPSSVSIRSGGGPSAA